MNNFDKHIKNLFEGAEEPLNDWQDFQSKMQKQKKATVFFQRRILAAVLLFLLVSFTSYKFLLSSENKDQNQLLSQTEISKNIKTNAELIQENKRKINANAKNSKHSISKEKSIENKINLNQQNSFSNQNIKTNSKEILKEKKSNFPKNNSISNQIGKTISKKNQAENKINLQQNTFVSKQNEKIDSKESFENAKSIVSNSIEFILNKENNKLEDNNISINKNLKETKPKIPTDLKEKEITQMDFIPIFQLKNGESKNHNSEIIKPKTEAKEEIKPFEKNKKPFSLSFNFSPEYSFYNYNLADENNLKTHKDFNSIQGNKAQNGAFGYSFGVGIGYRFIQNLSLQAKINYVSLGEEVNYEFTNDQFPVTFQNGEIIGYFTSVPDTIAFTKTNQYRFLELPLAFNFEKNLSSRFYLNFRLGSIFRYHLKSEGETINPSDLTKININNLNNKKWNFGWMIGIGLNYRLTENLDLGFTPTYTQSFQELKHSNNNLINQTTQSFGINTTIKFKMK